MKIALALVLAAVGCSTPTHAPPPSATQPLSAAPTLGPPLSWDEKMAKRSKPDPRAWVPPPVPKEPKALVETKYDEFQNITRVSFRTKPTITGGREQGSVKYFSMWISNGWSGRTCVDTPNVFQLGFVTGTYNLADWVFLDSHSIDFIAGDRSETLTTFIPRSELEHLASTGAVKGRLGPVEFALDAEDTAKIRELLAEFTQAH